MKANLRHLFEANHLEFKEKGITWIRHRQNKCLKSQKKKKKTQLVYCSFSQFKWKSHSNVLQEKISHFISWGRKTIAQGPVKPSTTDITACLLEDKSAKEITALPVSNNAVTVGVKVSCEHEDWVIQSNMELHFCLTIWQIWQDLQFCLFLLASALTHHQRSCNRGAEVFKGLTYIWILAYVLTESTNEPMGEMDGPFVQI